MNVVIHALNGLLVVELVRLRAGASGVERDAARRLGLATALLFALHPLQTEAVTYASGRSASLSTAFALASIVVWARGRAKATAASATGAGAAASGPATAGGGLAMRVVSPLLMGLGLAVKESAVVVPAILVLWLAVDAGRPRRLGAMVRETAMHWAVLVATKR